jgi:hypothetical protein
VAWGRGGGGGHTKGDILGSEVIAGSVVLCEPDDTHDGIDELNHQDGCEESSPWLKDDHPLPTRAASGTAAQPLLLQEPLAKQQEWKAGVPPWPSASQTPRLSHHHSVLLAITWSLALSPQVPNASLRR